MQRLLRPSVLALARRATVALPASGARRVALPVPLPRVATVAAASRRCFSTSATPSDADLAQWHSFNSAGLKFLSEGAFDRASMLFMSAMREPVVERTVYQYLSLSNLGIAFRHLKRYAEGKDVLMQSLAFLKAAPQVTDAMVASLHREAALCCEALEQMKEAEDLLQLSLHYYEQHGLAKQHAAGKAAASPAEAQEQQKFLLEQAGTHYSLALILHKTGLTERAAQDAASGITKASQRSAASQPPRLREALRHYKDALRLMRSCVGSDPSSKGTLLLAPVLASQGALQSELGDRASDAAAQASVLEALDIYKSHNDPRLLPLLNVYMQMLAASGDPALQQIVQQAKTEAADDSTKPQSK